VALALTFGAIALPAMAQNVVRAKTHPASGGPAVGLIVKFKDAVAHEMAASAGGREQADSSSRMRQAAQAAQLGEVQFKPVGRDAQQVDFGRVLSAAEAAEMAEKLRSQPNVEWVVPNEREHLMATPNDPFFAKTSTDSGQWWMRSPNELPTSYGVPNMQVAWNTTVGSASVVVAVLDTGITAHPELTGHVLPGYDFVGDTTYSNDGNGRDADPSDPGDWVTANEAATQPFSGIGCGQVDSSWHGTMISGALVAGTNNGTGVAGINWNGRVLPVRVAGKCGALVSDIIDGMRWAAGLHVTNVPDNPNPAKVINISFGSSNGEACGSAYQSAIDEVTARGVVVVAAAGNEHGVVSRPANCSGVVAVAALARDGLKAAYSNLGSQVTIATVGGDADIDDGLLTIFNDGTTVPAAPGYVRIEGTSIAAPIVSGTVGLMLSANPSLTVAQIVRGLQITSQPHVLSNSVPVCSSTNATACACTTNTCGAGILDANGAVQFALAPSDSSPPSDDGGGAIGLGWLLGLLAGIVGAAYTTPRRRST
jgi:serine protease